MRMTNFQTDDPALTKLLMARGFTANRAMELTFHPSRFSEVDEIVREFESRRMPRRAQRTENSETAIRSPRDLMRALANGR